MSTQQERVSVEQINDVLDEAENAFSEFEFETYEERLEYAKALGRKFRHQEGL